MNNSIDKQAVSSETAEPKKGLLAAVRAALLPLLVATATLAPVGIGCGDDELPDCPEGQVPVGKIDSDGDLTTVCDEVNDKIQECDGFPMQVTINGQKTTICADFSLQDCEGTVVVETIGPGSDNKRAICETDSEESGEEASQ